MRNAFKLIFSVFLLAFISASSASPIVPDSFYVDPATPHCLAFRWFVAGDSNNNATCSLEYRETGTSSWYRALPMLRINGDTCDQKGTKPKITGNLFSGSALNLNPGTSYDIRANMIDPDGGAFQKTATASTNKYPPIYVGNEVHVYPPGHSSTKLDPNYATISAAVNAVSAGTVILVHGGTYASMTTISKAAMADKPIIIRGAGDGDAIIDFPGYAFRMTSTAKHIYIENIIMRNCQYGVFCSGTEGIVVRNCEITNVLHGIFSRSNPAKNCFFMNNRITGKVNWYPRNSSAPESYGIVTYGSNMVVCYNTISKFFDCIETTGNFVEGGSTVPRDPSAICVDIYNNDILEANDDLVEIDYAFHNIRLWHNRLWNGHTGISAQPFFGGPAYLFRNIVFNCTQTCLKFHNQPSGIEIYHNSFLEGFFANPGNLAFMQNSHFRNNAFIGYEVQFGKNLEIGTHGGRCTFDYNGYVKSPGPSGYFFGHWDDNGVRTLHRDLAELRSILGWEENGFFMQNSDYVRGFQATTPGIKYSIDTIDARIASATATPIDKGMLLPTISDGFAGIAPDIGAIEYGDSLPHYGVYTTEADLEEDTVAFTGSSVKHIKEQSASLGNNLLISSFKALHKYAHGTDEAFSGIEVFNIKGKLVKSVNSDNLQLAWHDHLPNGMYLVVMSFNKDKKPTRLKILKVK